MKAKRPWRQFRCTRCHHHDPIPGHADGWCAWCVRSTERQRRRAENLCSKCGLHPRQRSHTWCQGCRRSDSLMRWHRVTRERKAASAGDCLYQSHDWMGDPYMHFQPGRRCGMCNAMLSIFNAWGVCRPCAERHPQEAASLGVGTTVAQHIKQFSRRSTIYMERVGRLGRGCARKNTNSPRWVHPWADALEQWESYCEEVYA